MKKLMIALLVIAALATAGVVSALSYSNHADGPGEGHHAGCIGDQLTEDQKEALSQLIQDLRDGGATPEEVREAVQQFLEEQGIDAKDCPMRGEGRGPVGGCIEDKLTEEQKEAFSQLIQDLRDAGATPEEIQKAIQQFLEEQGIDAEDCPMRGEGRGPVGGCIGDQLTEEQKEALSQLVKDLKDAGATPEEVREAVQQFLEEQGVDTENCQGTMGPKGGHH